MERTVLPVLSMAYWPNLMKDKRVYSVGQVNRYIKGLLQEDFLLERICIKGEVSNCKYHSSGHIYFTLKDEDSAISAIMFAGDRRSGLDFAMKDGDQVLASGNVGVYERGGTYQIYVKALERAGEGDLYLRFQRLKQELEEMGMFAEEYKQPIPHWARRIGIVTAPTGAAVRDIIQISGRRNPHVELILYPARVQGEGAAESIVQGLETLDAMDLDVLIVGRGGGSIEDLWAFNEEIVARAVFACHTPVISAVGHETDTTICDFVADLRAPTPSAAAELAVFSYEEFTADRMELRRRFSDSMESRIQELRKTLQGYSRELNHLSPAGRLNERRQYVLHLEQRLQSEMERILAESRNAMALYASRLEGASPAKKLSQGFGFAVDEKKRHISSVRMVRVGDPLTLHLEDGSIETQITEIKEEESWNRNQT